MEFFSVVPVITKKLIPLLGYLITNEMISAMDGEDKWRIVNKGENESEK